VRDAGLQFDQVAEAYDRERPTYPDELVEAVLEIAGLAPGDRVLEIGCGTGKLTGALVDRGLSVVALDPGASMIERARRISPGAEFVQGRFEDVALAEASFQAVFSAAAFHWVDPAVSWAKAASLLAPGGTLVLMGYVGVSDPEMRSHDQAFLSSLERIAPEIAASFPVSRDAESTLSGARRRADNVSEAWSWVGQHELAAPEAADLYEDLRVLGVERTRELTAAHINAQLRTTSLAFRLGPERMAELEAENERILSQLGGRRPVTLLWVAVTARRA
jgi:SAM-dependent methyltransferase